MSFHDSAKKIFFQNTKKSEISSQIIDFKNLDDSEVIFQALQTSAASLTSMASVTSLASTASKAIFPQKDFLVLMVWSSQAPKWPILVIFFRMDLQKSNFLLIYGTSFYWRLLRPAYFTFWKLVDETEMPKPQKHADTFIIIWKLFLVGLRGLQSISKRVQAPCM